MFKKIFNYMNILKNQVHQHNNMNNNHIAMLFSNKQKVIGFNNDRTKFNKSIVPSVHAEMDVLYKHHKMTRSNKKFSILVIRINKNGHVCDSKPCQQCIDNLKSYNINKIYYSDSDGNIVCENMNYIENRQSSGFRNFKKENFGNKRRRRRN